MVPSCRPSGGGGDSGGRAEAGGETLGSAQTDAGCPCDAPRVCLQVKEEAGFDCEPITLLLIQEQGPQWIRFIYLAKVTG